MKNSKQLWYYENGEKVGVRELKREVTSQWRIVEGLFRKIVTMILHENYASFNQCINY